MGFLSKLNKERKRATRKVVGEVERAAGSIEDAGESMLRDFERRTSDTIKLGTLGLIDPKAMERAKSAQKRADRAAKKIQVRQSRATKLEEAELQNEVALRTKAAKGGGRALLNKTGQTGSLLA